MVRMSTARETIEITVRYSMNDHGEAGSAFVDALEHAVRAAVVGALPPRVYSVDVSRTRY